jgi:hypothetical protein
MKCTSSLDRAAISSSNRAIRSSRVQTTAIGDSEFVPHMKAG